MSGKLSFSERDKRRREDRRDEGPQRSSGHARDRYRDAKLRGDTLSAAETLFGGAKTKDLEQAVLGATGRSERTEAARALVAQRGMPSAPNVLTQMLKISDERLVAQVLEALAESIASASPAVREVAARTVRSRGALIRDKNLRLAIKAFLEQFA